MSLMKLRGIGVWGRVEEELVLFELGRVTDVV